MSNAEVDRWNVDATFVDIGVGYRQEGLEAGILLRAIDGFLRVGASLLDIAHDIDLDDLLFHTELPDVLLNIGREEIPSTASLSNLISAVQTWHTKSLPQGWEEHQEREGQQERE